MIHVETEELRRSGIQIGQTVEEMWESVLVLRGLAENLEIQWAGGAAAHEAAEGLRLLVASLRLNLAFMDEQARALVRQANGWEESDQNWKIIYSKNMQR